eukprot:9494682-Pyramimonas_sp.AAC.1
MACRAKELVRITYHKLALKLNKEKTERVLRTWLTDQQSRRAFGRCVGGLSQKRRGVTDRQREARRCVTRSRATSTKQSTWSAYVSAHWNPAVKPFTGAAMVERQRLRLAFNALAPASLAHYAAMARNTSQARRSYLDGVRSMRSG